MSNATNTLLRQSLNYQIRNCKMALAILSEAPQDRIDLNNYARATECGTMFCALGWIARVPYFRSQRLFIAADSKHQHPRHPGSYFPTVVVGGETFTPLAHQFGAKLNEMFGSTTRATAWDLLFCPCFGTENVTSHRDVATQRFQDHIQYLEHQLSCIEANT